MGKTDLCTCRYSHCPHSGDPFPKIEAVKVGNVYYHSDCYKEKETINKIIDYFAKEINQDVVFAALRRTINNICFPKNKEGISPERLLFQLKYCKEHNWHITQPAGLFYVVQDRNSYAAYVQMKTNEKIKGVNFRISDEQNRSKEGSYTVKKQKSFEDILRPGA